MESVDASELTSAEALGLSRWQVFCWVQAPQMLRFSAPGVLNEFTSILKCSPFAYTVGIPEITKQATVLASQTLQGAEIYLAIVSTIVLASRWLHKRLALPKA